MALAAAMLTPMATGATYSSRAEKQKAMKETLATDRAAIKADRHYTSKKNVRKVFPWMKRHDVKEIKAPAPFKEGLKNAVTASSAMQAPVKFTPNPNAIYGAVIDLPGWPVMSSDKPYAIYEVLQKDAGNLKKIKEHHGLYAGGGGVMADGKYYAIDDWPQSFMGYSIVTYYTYDAYTWECIGDEQGYDFTDEGSIASDLAYDPTTGLAYGTFLADPSVGEEGSYVFGAMDFEDGPFRGDALAEYDDWYLAAIGCTADGKLYGIDPNGIFYSIDKTDAKMTRIADTGLKNEAGDLTTGAIDPYTGKFIYFLPSNVRDEATYTKTFYLTMYAIDCANGAVTEIGQVENGPQLVGGFMYPAPPSDNAPGPVTNLTATAAPDGVLKATVSFTAPSVTSAGETLTQLERVDIKLGRTIAATKECSPGENVSVEIATVQGENEISVTPYNASGAGETSKVTVYTGQDMPADPVTASATVQKDGSVLISWEAPAKGLNGGFIDPSSLKYNIYGASGAVASNVTGTSYVFTPANDEPTIVYFTVFARNSAGGSPNGTKTNTVPVGRAYDIPFMESFPEAYPVSGPWTIDQTDEAEWGTMKDMGEDLYAADGDNGYAVFLPGNTTKSASRLYSVKIDISKTSKPRLFFQYAGVTNRLKAQVAKNGGQFVDVKAIDLKTSPAVDWAQASVDLSDYKDADFIQVGFLGEAVNDLESVIVIDDIRVTDNVDRDLAAIAIHAPSRVQVGKEFEIAVDIVNRGNETAETYKTVLLRDGNMIAEEDGETISSGAMKKVVFNVAAAPAWGKKTELSARVILSGDQAGYNDMTAPATLLIEQAAYPTTELSAETGDSEVRLSWTPVTLENIATTPIVEDFEDPTYEDFTIKDFGDWTLRDEDKSKSTYVVGIPVPGQEGFYSGYYEYPNVGSPMAFQLLNPVKAGMTKLSPEWTPKSGDRMMVAFNAEYVEGEDNVKTRDDDWLISPLLPGIEQKISLWARGVDDEYGPEKMQILYSETGKDINDFVRLKAYDIPAAWTEVTAELPEGSKYFAVRCTSLDVFAMMVDDIKFIPDWQLPADCDVEGYNLYRNGIRLNDTPIAGTSYTDATSAEPNIEYVATVVYSNGIESCASNRIVLNPSGIADVNAEGITVLGGKGCVNVVSESRANVQVFDAAGRIAASGLCQGEASIRLQAGTYIVKAGTVTAKVLVK